MTRFLCFLVPYFFMSLIGLAQTGSIKGSILDESTGEGVIGANVLIEGTSMGVSTDVSGEFVLYNIKPGDYTLLVTNIAYVTKRIDVKVQPGKAAQVSLKMKENVSVLSDIVVQGVRETSNDIALLQSIKASKQVVSGISAEQISRSPDSDASQVVKRIPGVTIIQDRFIVIRGLNERYNSTLLHNVYAPSVESDVKSFSFDIIPSNMLDQVLIYKSPSADLPGDFAGGAVKVLTKGVSDENRTSISMSVSAREGTAFHRFMGQKRGTTHWTGFNDGSNNLPAGFPDAHLRSISSLEQRAFYGRLLPNNWEAQNYNAGVDSRFVVSHSHKFKIKDVQIGNITSVNYSNRKAVYHLRNLDYDVYNYELDQSDVKYDYKDEQFNQDILTGLIHNWAFRFSPNHVVEFKNLFNQSASYQYVDRFGPHHKRPGVFNNFSYLNEYRTIYSGQLMGTHSLFSEKTKLDWVFGLGKSNRDMPDYRRYRVLYNYDPLLSHDELKAQGPNNLFVPDSPSVHFLGKFYSNMSESSYSGGINVEQELSFIQGEKKPTIKTGFFYESKEREFSARDFGFTMADRDEFNRDLQYGSIGALFQEENINTTTGINLIENTNSDASYIASNLLKAGYISLFVPIYSKLAVVGGLRYEDNMQTLLSANAIGPISKEYPVGALLPSVNVSYNLTDKALIRLAYGKTLNRPEFRELAPFNFYDFNFDATRKGNENLSTAYIHNFDLRWELFPAAAEMISVGAFHKRFINPIELILMDYGSEQKVFSYFNAQSAINWGFELDMRKSLVGLTSSKFIDDLSVLINASWIDSEVLLRTSENEKTSRVLQGQSPYIINTGLYYNNVNIGLQVNVLYNVIGRRLFAVGNSAAIPDTYEMPRNVLDLTFSKRVSPALTLKGGIKDLINQNFMLVQDARLDGEVSRNSQLMQSFNPGRQYSLGLTFDF